jgi:parallel beta-helix repeat protein
MVAAPAICISILTRVSAWPAATAQPPAEVVLNVRDFGAVGNGAADDSVAVLRAQRALPESGGVVYFPDGVYAMGGTGIVLVRSSVTFRGAGQTQTVLKRLPPGGAMVQSTGANQGLRAIAFEAMTFDGDSPASGAGNHSTMALYGSAVSDVRVSRCRFWRSPSAAITLTGMSNVVIEDSLFQSAGNATSTGVSMTGGASHVTVRRNRFLYVRDGIVIDTGAPPPAPQATAEFIEVSDNYFDLAWWLLTARFTGEGDGVTYTAAGLSDPKARFDFVSSRPGVAAPYSYNIRVMPRRASGTARIANQFVEDARAAFQSAGVRRGEVVRAGGALAVVASVPSETRLEVEEWLSDTDRLAVAPPSDPSAYAVYGVILGMTTTFTSTTLGTTRWWDFDGRTVTPSAGTRYEVLVSRPNYPVHAEAGTRHITIANNTLRRGWSDQISLYGSLAVVRGNTIEDGEDMGITLHGQGNTVEGNRVTHQGAGGIYVTSSDTLIARNIVRDSQWVNNVNVLYLGDIMLYDARRVTVVENVSERLSTTLGYHGIVVYGARGGSADNTLSDNVSRNHLRADIKLAAANGSTVAGTRLVRNEGTLASAGATGTVIVPEVK